MYEIEQPPYKATGISSTESTQHKQKAEPSLVIALNCKKISAAIRKQHTVQQPRDDPIRLRCQKPTRIDSGQKLMRVGFEPTPPKRSDP